MTDEDQVALLKGHILPEFLRSERMADERKVETLKPSMLQFVQSLRGLFIKTEAGNTVEVAFVNNLAENGVVHELKQVMI